MPEDKQAQAAAQQSSKPELPRLTGLKKRQQIELAGRAMFIWVAIAAVALSFCIATGQYMLSKWDHNNKILGAKYLAVQTLSTNVFNAQELKQSVDSLVANQDLASVKTKRSDPNTKSVLDALPTNFDPAALATSLQQAIFSKSGVTLESISVPPEATETPAAPTAGTAVATSAPLEMRFNAVVSGPFNKIKNLMNDLQRTIRPMKLISASMTGDDSNLRTTLEIVTYYQPAKSVILQKEAIE